MGYDRKSMAGHADWPEWVSPVRAAVVVVTVVVLVAVLAWIGVRHGASIRTESAASVQRHDSLTHTYTHDGTDIIRVYVVTDPDAGVQYVVSDHGGITPRLDRHDRVMETMTE